MRAEVRSTFSSLHTMKKPQAWAWGLLLIQ